MSNRRNTRLKQQQADDLRVEEQITILLMSSAQGRRWVWIRLTEAGIFRTHFDYIDSHPRMSYADGLRNAGLRLYAAVQKYALPEFVRMMEESAKVDLHLNTTEEEEDPDADPS